MWKEEREGGREGGREKGTDEGGAYLQVRSLWERATKEDALLLVYVCMREGRKG